MRNVAHTSQVKIKRIGGKVRGVVLAGAERMRDAWGSGKVGRWSRRFLRF